MDRKQKAIQEARIKEHMKEPINQFMNALDKEGKPLYPLAEKMQKYLLLNPDPVLNGMRMANALLHEMRWHKEQAKKYYMAHSVGGDENKMYDKFGKPMSSEDCYIAYIQENQVCHTVVAKLRSYLMNDLLKAVDNNIFTFEMYNDYVMKIIKILREMGHELFPEKVELIEPM